MKLQIAGLNAGWDRTTTRPGPRPGSQSVWYWQGDRLLAVDAMNDPRAYMTAKRWIEAGVSPDPARSPTRRRTSRRSPDADRRRPRIAASPLAALGAGDPAAHLRPTADRVRESLFNLLAHGPYGDPPPPEGRARARPLRRHRRARARGALARRAPRELRRPGPAPRWRSCGATSRRLGAEEARPRHRPRRHPARRATRAPPFDLVFLDPPYGRGLGEKAIASALAGGWVAPGGLVVWEEGVNPPRRPA